MGLLDFFRWLLSRKKQEEALPSDASDAKAISQRFEAIQKPLIEVYESSQPQEITPSIQLEKESLQLGIAAGYTGRSLKTIESSLARIESQMITRDWFDLSFGQKIKELIDILKQHEDKEQLRFEAIQHSLNSLKNITKLTPQPIRSQLYKQIQAIESQLPLSPRMREIFEIVKQSKEISYEDLAKRLNIGVSGLRGLLSNMLKRTSDVERFEKDGKGWLRFIGNKDLNRFQSEQRAGEAVLRDNFEITEKQTS